MESTKIKTTLFQAIFVTSVIFGIVSCEQKDKDHDASDTSTKSVSTDVAEDQNEGKFTKNDEEKNAEFLVKAAEINLEEISLGILAQKKSTNKDIKELGKMIENAHVKALADLQKLADSKSISIPTELPQDAKNLYQKMDGKSEKDFNKDYADKMVSGHKDAIALFEKQSTESSDVDIRSWATSMLPELRMHLDQAIVVQEKNSKM